KTVPFRLAFKRAYRWNAEEPFMGSLWFRLTGSKGVVVDDLIQPIGLRETKVAGTQILINGSPVKFRGTCHHDSDPLDGRAVSVQRTEQDLQLIKEANLNALRTSHYPPIPELLDIADRKGIYVEDEASFCWVGVADDLRNYPRILQLTAEMVARDRNHPSVFEWSLCNESSYGWCFERSHEWVRKNDPSRPTSAATSAWTEIATLHNPISIRRIQENEHIGMPLMFDESLCIYQGIFNDVAEMWVDPGIRDYYIEPLIGAYKAFMDSKTTQGSMIWCWSDDIFCVPGRGIEYGRESTKSHFIDDEYKVAGRGLVGDAPWGVVDGWRRPKPEFWLTKKLHSPVKLSEKPLLLATEIRIPVENQYDFTNLSSLKASYACGNQKGRLILNVPPRSKGEISIHLHKKPRVGDLLDLKFTDSAGFLVDEFSVPFGGASLYKSPALGGSPLQIHDESWLAGEGVRVSNNLLDIAFDKATGQMRRCVMNGQSLLLDLPAIHLLPADSPMAPIPDGTQWKGTGITVRQERKAVRVKLAGGYPGFQGGYEYLIHPNGVIDAGYSFKYTGENTRVREIGWTLDMPRQAQEFSWRRRAEWNVYPPDHIGRPTGSAVAFHPLSRWVKAHGRSTVPRWAATIFAARSGTSTSPVLDYRPAVRLK
ncbi:MAG TPA: glycoside hydrolase family 2 TIM barrel-domain containing protein, partial [Fimbriimonas sp.]|nr:glycoside hydrolase family 2 TIM barrel-domain containing protein [Fimbriimonas sp.]